MWARSWSVALAYPLGWFGPLPSAPDYFPFDQTPILDVRTYVVGTDLHIAWDSTSPDGACYQIYINGRLAWDGFQTFADVAYAVAGGRVSISVGVVGLANRTTDYSYLLELPADRALLSWSGGRYQHPTPARFRVYASAVAGGPVSTVRPVATVEAAPEGTWPDGWGRGGFGRGGFGHGEVRYSWTSRHLDNGVWTFLVTSVDLAGNEEPLAGAPTCTVTIAGPPGSPPPRADGRRMWIDSYDAAAGTFTLGWNAASP